MAGGRGLVSRRQVLGTASRGAVVVGLAALVGACDVRLEDDAPDLPLLRRKSIPDEALLIATYQQTTALAQMVGRIPGAPAQVVGLARIHAIQAAVLHDRLTAGGVPDHVITEPVAAPPGTATSPPSGTAASAPSGGSPTAPSGGSTTPGPAVSAPPAATVADLAAAEGAAVAGSALADLAAATTANRTVLTAISCQRAFAALALGAAVTWPAADPLPSSAARTLLDATRSVGFAFQVIAAQTTDATRTAAQATRQAIDEREATLATMSGAGTPPAPLGYVLPAPVTTPEAAQQLATTVLTRLVTAGLGPLPTLGAGPTALTELVRLQAQAQRLGQGWGVAAVPFPGMVYP